MIVLLSFFLLALYYYFQDNKGAVFFCLTAIITNSFGFIDPEEMSIKSMDIILVFVFITLIAGWLKNKYYFNVKGDAIALIILIITAYILLNLIGTIALKIESPSNALKVARPFFAYLLYFYVRSFTKKDLLNYINILFFACIIQGLFYYLQLFDINVLSGRVDEAEVAGEITRYANYPKTAPFFFIYFLISHKESFLQKMFGITFFGMMLIMGQTRGAVISLVATLGVFLLLKRRLKHTIFILAGVIAYQLIVAPMFEYRTRHAQESTFTEIINVLKDPTNVYRNFTTGSSDGSFSFRIAILSERIIYIFQHPKYIPFGVGCIHEESSANTITFQLGTRNDRYECGISMLDSADIAWVGLFMRLGFCGVFLFLRFFYLWAKAGLPYVWRSNDSLFITASIMVVSSFLISFDSDNISRLSAIMVTIFYLAIICICNHDKNVNFSPRNVLKSGKKWTVTQV